MMVYRKNVPIIRVYEIGFINVLTVYNIDGTHGVVKNRQF